MFLTNERWIAALIAAHPDHIILGRARLQMEIKLLQRLGFPTDYSYMTRFYGPYSESLQFDFALMKAVGLIDDSPKTGSDGCVIQALKARESDQLPDVSPYHPAIERLVGASAVGLELAVTYDAFREQGDDHDAALRRLRRKKSAKCEGGNEEAALELLNDLGLETK